MVLSLTKVFLDLHSSRVHALLCTRCLYLPGTSVGWVLSTRLSWGHRRWHVKSFLLVHRRSTEPVRSWIREITAPQKRSLGSATPLPSEVRRLRWVLFSHLHHCACCLTGHYRSTGCEVKSKFRSPQSVGIVDVLEVPSSVCVMSGFPLHQRLHCVWYLDFVF